MPITRLVLLVSAALGAPCALAALDNYTIDMRREIGSLNVEASATAGPVAMVQVANRSSSRVRCFVDFEGGRLTPARREAWLDPGTIANVRQPVNDPDIERLSVGLSCDTLSADEPIPAPNALGQLIIRGTPQGTTGLPATAPVQPRPPFTPTPTPAPRPPANSGTATVISPR